MSSGWQPSVSSPFFPSSLVTLLLYPARGLFILMAEMKKVAFAFCHPFFICPYRGWNGMKSTLTQRHDDNWEHSWYKSKSSSIRFRVGRSAFSDKVKQGPSRRVRYRVNTSTTGEWIFSFFSPLASWSFPVPLSWMWQGGYSITFQAYQSADGVPCSSDNQAKLEDYYKQYLFKICLSAADTHWNKKYKRTYRISRSYENLFPTTIRRR